MRQQNDRSLKRETEPFFFFFTAETVTILPPFLPLSFASKKGRIIAVVTPSEIVRATPCYSQRSLQATSEPPPLCQTVRIAVANNVKMKRGQPAREEASPSPLSTPATEGKKRAKRGSIVRREILDTGSETSGLSVRGLNDRGR